VGYQKSRSFTSKVMSWLKTLIFGVILLLAIYGALTILNILPLSKNTDNISPPEQPIQTTSPQGQQTFDFGWLIFGAFILFVMMLLLIPRKPRFETPEEESAYRRRRAELAAENEARRRW
jgi:hypothetical protein